MFRSCCIVDLQPEAGRETDTRSPKPAAACYLPMISDISNSTTNGQDFPWVTSMLDPQVMGQVIRAVRDSLPVVKVHFQLILLYCR